MYVFIVLTALACTDQGNPDPVEINLHFRNTGTVEASIETYAEGLLRKSESVGPMQSGSAYTFYTPNEFDNFGFVTDSLVVKYPNGKGYVCSPGGNLCIASKPSPVDAAKEDFVREGDSYYYVLSQDDYANAFDLE